MRTMKTTSALEVTAGGSYRLQPGTYELSGVAVSDKCVESFAQQIRKDARLPVGATFSKGSTGASLHSTWIIATHSTVPTLYGTYVNTVRETLRRLGRMMVNSFSLWA